MVSSDDDGDGGCGDCSGYLFSSHSMCSPLLYCLPAMASLLADHDPLSPLFTNSNMFYFLFRLHLQTIQ